MIVENLLYVDRDDLSMNFWTTPLEELSFKMLKHEVYQLFLKSSCVIFIDDDSTMYIMKDKFGTKGFVKSNNVNNDKLFLKIMFGIIIIVPILMGVYLALK